MDFSFSEDQLTIFNSIKENAIKGLNDDIFTDDENSTFSRTKWNICGDMGIYGMPVPEQYGGEGFDMLTTALAMKALGYGCQDEGLMLSICAHLCTFIIPIVIYGTEEQKKKYLPDACSGKMIGGNGISEANAGSDISSIETKVDKQEDRYILKGSKIFVTNGPIADTLVIYAKHSNGLKMFDMSALLVNKDEFKYGQQFKKMGLRTSPLCEIVLDDCSIPEDRLIGRQCFGLKAFQTSMHWERIITSAYNIGAMERQFETVHEYTNTRTQFGNKISNFANISDKLVDMKMKIELANLMLYKTCWNFDNGSRDMSDASMLKLYVSEAKVSNSLNAVHLFGAYGYLKESIVEKQLRDAISSTIYSGTSEIQRKIISERLGKFYE